MVADSLVRGLRLTLAGHGAAGATPSGLDRGWAHAVAVLEGHDAAQLALADMRAPADHAELLGRWAPRAWRL
eukprot:10970580-Lingulodinium_polyedra.AAC.1